jgi:hypothetical protein
MNRSTLLIAAAGAAALAVTGLAVAKADNLLAFGHATPAIDTGAAKDRQIAKAAFTQVLSSKAEVLGMIPPSNLAPYAPIYPDGLILQASYAPNADSGGSLQYDAAASLRTTLDFYEDAAALHHMPFTVAADGPDILVFKASSGPRRVEARLTRQFDNGTVVDLSYE